MVNQSDIEIINKFIPALVQKHHDLKIENFNSEHYHLHKLFTGLNYIEKERQIYIKENAPYFNIFDILRYGHYETRLHTPFLVHLLSPDGHHQIEKTFFKLFIDFIFNTSFHISELNNIEVFEELEDDMLEGRIDIFIKFNYKNELYFVAIENKIDAYDQEDQLRRYYDYLILRSHKQENHRLIYLSKFGDKPAIPYSIDEDKYNQLLKSGVLILLSYRKDISYLIKQLLIGKNPTPVVEILNQYLKTLNNF